MSQNAAIGNQEAPVKASLLTPTEARDAVFQAAWEDLYADLVEENPFYAPWSLLPALEYYADERVRIAAVWRGDALIGLAPVAPARSYARLPVRYWRVWTHPHCYFAAPLVRKGCEDAFFEALYAALCEGGERRGFLRLVRLDRNGPLLRSAVAVAARDRRIAYEAGGVERAMLCAGASAEATLTVFVRKKKRKELKRLRNRLEELGRIDVREFSQGEDLDEWTDAFLDLEHRGWKGDQGTSLKTDKKDACWFRKTLTGAFLAGQLHFMRIDLDRRPVAMLANLVAQGSGYSVKICHDPDYARYSPGVMVEIEAMRSLLESEKFRFMDSCAAPDHSMINGLWRARRVVTGLNVSAKGAPAQAALNLCRLLEGARASMPPGRASTP